MLNHFLYDIIHYRIVDRSGDPVFPGMGELYIIAHGWTEVGISQRIRVPVNEPDKGVEALVTRTSYPSSKIRADDIVLVCLVLEKSCWKQLGVLPVKILSCSFLPAPGIGILEAKPQLRRNFF